MAEVRTIVCSHVFAATHPVLLVCVEDGELLSLCGAHHAAGEEFHVVGLPHLMLRDPSLRTLPVLSEGRQAEREFVGAAWIEGPLD